MSKAAAGLPSVRHNGVRDLTAKLLTEICSQVATKPDVLRLFPEGLSLSTVGTQEGARLNIAAMIDFWEGRSERAFVYVYVFNLLICSFQHGYFFACLL